MIIKIEKYSSLSIMEVNPIWTRVLKLPIWTRGGAKLPYTLKNLKNAYIPMKLTQNEVINIKFWNLSKKLFLSSMTSPWRHYDVIIMWFSIFLGQKLKPLYLWNNLSHRICSYIVGKHLPSSKRWLINEMDVSVPDWEISVLNIDKIPEKSGKLEFFLGIQKFQFLKID